VRSQGSASLVVFDLDHFKQVNDRWGHPAGDSVLRTTAMVCSEVKRAPDILGRLGGEEFGVLMPGIAGSEAVAAAERLRAAVAATTVPDWPDIPFTASFGVADLDISLESTGLWVASADAALYRAKQAGRNRVAN
jgi:diguanylate cyclase (GGDEF)-like protein